MSEPFWTPLGGQPVDYEGTYNPATQYAPGDVVVYNGVTYIAVNPSLGSTPPPAVVVPTPFSQGVGFPLDRVGLLDTPDARSDEFNVGTTINPKWSLVGTAPAGGVVVASPQGAPEGLWINRTDVNVTQLTAYLQALTVPARLYAKVAISTLEGTNCRRGGIVLAPASPTTASPCVYIGSMSGAANGRSCNGVRYSNFSTFSANYGALGFQNGQPTLWIRVDLLAGLTSYDAYASMDGHSWQVMEMARAVGFTIGTVGVGFAMEGQASAATVVFDHFRVVPT